MGIWNNRESVVTDEYKQDVCEYIEHSASEIPKPPCVNVLC